jgi:hypothetical protein
MGIIKLKGTIGFFSFYKTKDNEVEFGSAAKSRKWDGKKTTLNLNLPSGMYFLLVGVQVVKVQVVR